VRLQQDEFAALLSRESGKPGKAALSEVQSAAALIDYFAQESLRLAGHIPLMGNPREKVLIVREPVGVVVGITPFNYPLSTLISKLAPALAVGCTVVVKPDEHTPLCALRLAQLALTTGLPPGVFNVVTGTGPETGHHLVHHPLPRLIAFTGSTAVGKKIQAASAPWVRKTILELGGHCPAIICADAPWQDLLPQLVAQIFKNTGQYCYRISRIFVAESIAADFLQGLLQAASALKVGPAADPATDLGPLNNAEIHASIVEQVGTAVRQGARVELGGCPLTAPPCERGFYFPPTILTNVNSDMAIMREEIFGPVVMIQPFADVARAIDQANATPYGLAAYLFTRALGNALEWAEQLECGSVWINQIHQAYPQAPFGGMKESGLGREKSRFGIEEYTELKTIYLSY
jgi:succinate-semialdehyde dehydrogenase / glutarate-semialdehyde dehydrogenase